MRLFAKYAITRLFFERMPNVAVHSIAQTGFGAGTNQLYDRARPSYQSFALSYIRKFVKGTAPLNIVEVGAGTGIFTRALLAHPEWASSVRELKAIEPSQGMREVFTEAVRDHRVVTFEGTFDKTGVEDGWADLVVVAQAFHWCPDYDAASVEFARILKPNGIVAFIWNLEDRQRARWVAQLRDRIEKHEAGTPQFRHNYWRKAFETQTYQRRFEAPIEEVWSYTLPVTHDAAMERALSKSYIAVLTDEEKTSVKQDVLAILDRGEDRVWLDENEGVFEYPYRTFVVIANHRQCMT